MSKVFSNILDQTLAEELVLLIGAVSEDPPQALDPGAVHSAFKNGVQDQAAKGSLIASRGMFWALSGAGSPGLAEAMRMGMDELVSFAGCTDPIDSILHGEPTTISLLPCLVLS
jgi:hypothetical protein